MALDHLELRVGDVTRSFAEWTKDYVDWYYPGIGRIGYRVPALHFNKQARFGRDPSGHHILGTPLIRGSDSTARHGDLAHSLVLEKLEGVSERLQHRDSQPLFLISSMQFENYLANLKPPQPCGRLPPRPKNADPSQTQKRPLRGEIDVLILHETHGVVLVEVKATGVPDPTYNPPSEDQRVMDQRSSVAKAVRQLDRGRQVLLDVMADLDLEHCISLVVALPFLSRSHMEQVINGMTLDPNLRFLCKDDLGSGERQSGMTTPCRLLLWWDSCLPRVMPLPLQSMKTIVGRVCGLMSIVPVWTRSTPRIEVRTRGQALAEAGRRLSEVVLLPSQAAVLSSPYPPCLCITGPMGSGKTLMLQLKGRQWLREGRRVVVLNVRFTGRGRPSGYVLEEAIRRVELRSRSGSGSDSCGDESGCGSGEGGQEASSVERLDLALDEYKLSAVREEIESRGPTDKLCFLVDELFMNMSFILQGLVDSYPGCCLWCVGTSFTTVPKCFQRFALKTVLRSPPSVQLMLRELDRNPSHQHAYNTRSAFIGLPCDGPPVIFIDHLRHDSKDRHLDCLQCADELADILETKLGLPLQGTTAKESAKVSQSSRNSHAKKAKVVQAAPLSFRDVLILVSMPFDSYVYTRPENYLWEPSILEVFHYLLYMGTCRFLARLRQRGVPVRVTVDNTTKEIGLPDDDEVIMNDIMGGHSLERKVVVFLRSGPRFTDAEIQEHLTRYRSSAQDDPDPQATSAQLHQLSEILPLFASCMSRGGFCGNSNTDSLSETQAFLEDFFGNMLLPGTHAKGVEEAHASSPTENPEAFHTHSLRMGMEIRGDFPQECVPRPDQAEDAAESTSTPSSISCPASSSPTPSSPGADSDFPFLNPDDLADLELRQEEVERIRRALDRLPLEDQDWELFAASRALSQYISILP